MIQTTISGILRPMNDKVYSNNQEPKVGDKVRLHGDVQDGVDALYEVIGVGGGRLGNKVTVRQIGLKDFCREYYYYCLCPQ